MRRRQLWLLTIPAIVCGALVAMTQQMTDHLGTMHFPISCPAQSQAAFNRTMAFPHGARVQEANIDSSLCVRSLCHGSPDQA